MSKSIWLIGCLTGLMAASHFSEVQANPNHLTDPATAAKLGITVQQVHSLEAKFALSNEQLLELPRVQLQLMLEDLGHPGIDKHAGQQQFQMLRMKDEHGQIPPDGLMRALEHRRHSDINTDLFPGLPDPSLAMPDFGTPGPQIAGITNGGWTWLGPGNIGGRVRAILIHPTATNILWCGGVDGGVWKSTNNGAAWFPLDDFMANLAISTMVMDPADPNIIYAGTGEAMYNLDAVRGAGVFKTTDGGTTWTQLLATANSSYQYVSRLAISPSNSLVLLASTRGGIFRSADAGATWSQTLAVEMLDVVFHPTDTNQAVCSGYNGSAYYSSDGGLTWTAATGLPSASGFVVGRVEVAYSRSNPSIVFASVDNSSGQVYRSSDGGHSYSLRNTGNNYLSGQGWYDNVIWADPVNTNIVLVGGTDVWRSTDGGTTFTDIGGYSGSVHPDQHVIVASPLFNGTTIRTIFLGNDGGVFRAADAYTASSASGWQSLNNNLGITQFYGGAGNAGSGIIVGGTQDNGDLRYTPGGGPSGWTAMYGGDGGFSAADPSNANYFYGEYVYLQIHRSLDGGASAANIYSGITDAGSGSTANFIAPFVLDPNNPNTMLAGGTSLWRSSNVKAASPSWSAIKASISSPISAIAVAPGNSDIIWVGHNNGGVYYTTNGTAASPTWYQRNLGTPNLPGRYCERIAVHPFNSSKVYVSFGGYNTGNIWRTADSGVTWTDISGNLPAAPVNAITIAAAVTNTLYVGTEVGVYGTTADGTTWSTGNDGPANVSIDELFWMGNKLVAVTHGRGMFSITPALGSANLMPAGSTVSGGNGNGSVDFNECNQLNLAVQNVGGSAASNITATLTTSTPGVTVIQGSSAFPSIAAGGASATNSTPFQISTSPSFTCGTPVTVSLNLSYNLTNSTSLTYNLPSGGGGYAITTSSGAAIVPGTTDSGNHGDDVVTTVSLPFTWSFYGLSVSNAALSSNGNLQFLSSNNAYANSCLPFSSFNYAIMPFWDDLRTDLTGGGIFTSTTGSAPNRIFNIEWRATYYSPSGVSVNFEVRLYEGQSRFDIIYGTLNGTGSSATVGAQSDTGSSYLSYECNAGGLSSGLQLTFQSPCTDGGGACVVGLAANFNAAPLSGAVPLTVSFTNQSTGATNYSWAFGNGNTSSSTNPANVYTLAGNYSVTLTAIGNGATNSLTRTNYILATNVPPTIAAPPQNRTVPQGANATFAVTAAGSTPLGYQWRWAGQPLPGAAATNFTVTSAQCTNAGGYDVVVTNAGGSVTSSVAVLTVVSPPLVVAPPMNQTVIAGQTGAFNVTATNDCGGGLAYQWQHAGTNLAGATATTLLLTNAQASTAGAYTVVVTNLGGSLTSTVATLTVIIPPGIASSPTNQLLGQGTNALFSVSATGSAPLAYEWRFAGVAVTGATDSAYTRTNIQCSDAGSYDVIVTNAGGSVTSSVAALTVVSPPAILTQPADQTVSPGQTASLSVQATNDCGGGLVYQWSLNGTNLLNATNSAFLRTNAQPADAGSYTVVITNLAGAVTSSVATLTVATPSLLVLTPPSLDFGTAFSGSTATASFVVSNAGVGPLSGSATIIGGPFTMNGGTGAGLSVPALGSTNLTVQFTPPAVGVFSNAIVFATDGGSATNSLYGVGAPLPVILWPAQVGTNIAFYFVTIPCKSYTIEYRDFLDTGAWLPLQTLAGDGSTNVFASPLATPSQRFYRLSVY